MIFKLLLLLLPFVSALQSASQLGQYKPNTLSQSRQTDNQTFSNQTGNATAQSNSSTENITQVPQTSEQPTNTSNATTSSSFVNSTSANATSDNATNASAGNSTINDTNQSNDTLNSTVPLDYVPCSFQGPVSRQKSDCDKNNKDGVTQQKVLKYYLVFSTAQGEIYVYDPASGAKSMSLILSGLNNVIDVMIDQKNDILFVSEIDLASNQGTVSAYSLNSTFDDLVRLSVTAENRTLIYTGGRVEGMAVDSGMEILYLGDNTQKKIYEIDYSPLLQNDTLEEKAAVANQDRLLENVEFISGQSAVDSIGEMCTDYNNKLFWTGLANGSANGVLFQSNLNSDYENGQSLANNSEYSTGIAYSQGTLYYLGGATNLYQMDIEDQEPILISADLQNAQDLVYLKHHLFVADGTLGVVRYDLNEDITVNPPFYLDLGNISSKNITSITVLVAGAVRICTTFSLGLLLLLHWF